MRGAAELHDLVGDASKARARLGWKPTLDFEGLVRLLVDADLERLRRGRGYGRAREAALVLVLVATAALAPAGATASSAQAPAGRALRRPVFAPPRNADERFLVQLLRAAQLPQVFGELSKH